MYISQCVKQFFKERFYCWGDLPPCKKKKFQERKHTLKISVVSNNKTTHRAVSL